MDKNLILDFFKKHKYSYILGVIFMFISSYVATLFPTILGKTIDILKVNNFDTSKVKINILYIILIAVGGFVSTYIWRNLVIGNARSMECDIRKKLFDHMQKLSPEYYNRHKTGDLIAYAINDISAVRMAFGPATAMGINGMVICVASIYAMTRAINWRLTLLSLLPIPFIIVFIIKIGGMVRKRFRIVQESFAAISDRVQENIYGIRVIKSYVQEDGELESFEKLNQNMLDANLNMARVSSYLAPVIEICFSVSFVLNLIIGGNMVLNKTISLGDFIAFNTYLTIIMNPIISVGRIINIMQRGMASYKRLESILSVEPDIKDGEAMVEKKIDGAVEICNLSFAYPDAKEKALEDINIHIPQGHTVGVVGRTGSGKSTLANLLIKLYNVEKGQIYIDGIDINDYSLNALREGFGYVPQDNFLFSATIKENIEFFKKNYSLEEVENAAKNSCIYDSIVSFKDKFNTKLGERGVNLSGGQKQRIAIARALVKNPAILILDDSLSAVDTITEKQILGNFNKVREDKTAIIIAHKLSSVQAADEIIVLDRGRICERGTHEELLRQGGVYYEIYNEQSKDRENGLRRDA
ncbi:ABC transporter ATP-binding protein [Clostridium sp. 19966]|uniref:ABC transporter ATP-binding protein n=1 Tax=Clostridium sp. 19966 TaxID=2768166 RepID=UPI0028DEB326|nr:ABC transporter ATP-binding protein [Clostridium sp. 19966]MDT8717906.1 ABC transporter ATP-binding protein [Clostridium sp. 19966]